MKYRKKPVEIEAITFGEFIEYGRKKTVAIMNIIYGDRCSGKTTKLIMTSAVMNKPIVCRTYSNAEYIKSLATNLGINIPEPRVHKRGNSYRDGVLLDDANCFIKDALEEYIGAKIDACTFFVDRNSVYEKIESKEFK